MKKLTALQIMAFVASNSGAEHFDDDARLFAELFPDSPILKELKDAPKWQHGALDQRVLLEILEAVDPDTLVNNRKGSAKPVAKKPGKSSQKPVAKNKASKPGQKTAAKPVKDPEADKKKEDQEKSTLE